LTPYLKVGSRLKRFIGKVWAGDLPTSGPCLLWLHSHRNNTRAASDTAAKDRNWPRIWPLFAIHLLWWLSPVLVLLIF